MSNFKLITSMKSGQHVLVNLDLIKKIELCIGGGVMLTYVDHRNENNEGYRDDDVFVGDLSQFKDK